jgi:hypothetical protein
VSHPKVKDTIPADAVFSAYLWGGTVTLATTLIAALTAILDWGTLPAILAVGCCVLSWMITAAFVLARYISRRITKTERRLDKRMDEFEEEVIATLGGRSGPARGLRSVR